MTADQDTNSTVTDICALHAQHTADRIAVVCGDLQITYAALHARVVAAARALNGHGVHCGVVVGLFADRSPAAIVGLLAILRAGGTYLPLDPAWPSDRVTEICRFARLQLVVTAASSPTIAWPHEVMALRLESLERTPTSDAPMQLPSVRPQHPALIIYTSGSTGEPKGVVVSHGAIAARLRRACSLGGPHVQRAPISLIGHVGDLLAPLAIGVTLVMAPDTALRQAGALAAWLRDHAVRRLVLVPSQLRALMENDQYMHEWKALDVVVVTGESLPPTVAAAFMRRFSQLKLVNGYGLTETVGLVASAPIESADEITIGTGMPPSQLALMDDVFGEVGTGNIGELYVSGTQLASGYLHRPDLTADRFVPHANGAPGERCYRTGDIGRSTPVGIQLLGRRDDQVKIRGFRVSLIEVARVLERHDGVAAATTVAVCRTNGTVQLWTWVVPRPSSTLDSEALRRYVANHLPSYMVPTAIHVVDDLPYLPNGKVDRLALAATLDGWSGTPVPPRLNTTQDRIAEIWAEAFDVPAVGFDDDFFERGGDSLMLMTILARIAAELGVEVPPDEFFGHSTVTMLSQLIDRGVPSRGAS